MREVEEECSVGRLKILNKIDQTYHTYRHKDKLVLKVTHWFKMECEDYSQMKAQAEEGITEVKWIPIKDMPYVFNNSYQSIITLLKKVI